MGEKDITEKLLESYNDVFADIVNALLFNGESVIKPDELVDQSPRSAYKADGVIREIERDVAKAWQRNSIRIACLGIENQTGPDPDIALRVYGYDGAEYRSQLLKANRGKPRYPVVTLVLYFGYKKRWDKPTTLYEAVNVSDLFKPYVSDIKVNLFEIAFLSREQVKLFKSDFRIVADYFVQMRENGEYIPSPENLEHVQETLKLLNVMTNDRRFEEEYRDRSKRGEVHNMCEWLDRVEERNRKIGEERGRKIGEERGVKIGEEKGRKWGAEAKAKEAARNLFNMGMAPADIAKALNEALSEVQKWLDVATV